MPPASYQNWKAHQQRLPLLGRAEIPIVARGALLNWWTSIATSPPDTVCEGESA